MRVLIAAVACEPRAGSESFVGWNAIQALREIAELEVITTENNRTALEEEATEKPLGFRIHYLGKKKTWHQNRMLARLQSWLQTVDFSRQVFAKAWEIHTERPFDLTHHVTISTWRVSSPLWRLGIPFIWGPIGGGEPFPWKCHSLLSPQARIFEVAREISNIASRLSPKIRATAKNAAFCLAANEETKKLLFDLRGQKDGVEIMSPAMFWPERIQSLQAGSLSKPEGRPLRIFAGGNLEGRKGVAVALKALAIANNQGVDFVYRLGGHGPERSHLQNLAKELGLQDRIIFGDSLSGDDYLNELHKSHLYLLPSLREHTGLTLLEAMLAGCVPIVANGGGPGSIVAGDRGFKIAASDPAKMAAEIAEVICLLARDPGLREKLGREASRFVATEYSAKNYQDSMAEIYRKALAGKANEMRSA
jgi:glycosyltransferase involved in cell wall biosynthesis